ncbi:MAG: division/cell wall cluster transcriptional repressor MraZ [Rhodothermaceae bacterium]|nr:division/cell wall cluster transcriptional repressor MraZ [Bacteroidota bacterium]MXW15837.1 division/cell wall cluster transcriptional repressor MraZ [Rhodothermaceae bacterium]MCY3595606.1 division/cell wall cluster transcriptional repressor MraZ [Bacteroidota bacterium]MCY3628705.1 division/cell wall cluster transcriptional repressor MraZ [Bacteroidota bacterium]MDE2645348.1 division/cell wall cluster transcriptional repressor MraZ [Bacteroidota bacterium]
MPGFKGQATYSVDGKGRIAIPSRMRACMSPEAHSTLVITRGFERCIFAYPLDEWLEIEDQISKLNPYSEKHRSFIRQFMRWAEEVTIDAKGRIPLQRPLLEYAGIEKTSLILGSQKYLEVWDPQRFEEYLAAEETDYETLAAEVMGS